MLIGLYPLTNNNEIRVWSIIIALIFFILGVINSRSLTPLNLLWFRFGMFLGGVVSPLIMGIVFFFVVTPTGIIMRLLRKDLLRLKKNNSTTYWIKKKETKSDMRNQF